ncbi:MAG: hypothetical protein IPJ65_13815 [Archangiaceae bacterium]|nr:hypothetical protein [Archangiaceae bacterium]
MIQIRVGRFRGAQAPPRPNEPQELLMRRAAFFVLPIVLFGCNSPTRTVPKSSGSIAVSNDDALLYIADADHDRVTVLDAATLQVVQHVSVPKGPERVAVGPDGAVYVTSRGAGSVTRISRDGAPQRERAVGAEPVGLALDAQGKRLYVANASSGTVSVLDAETLEPLDELEVGGNPWAVVVGADDQLWVTDFLAATVSEVPPGGRRPSAPSGSPRPTPGLPPGPCWLSEPPPRRPTSRWRPTGPASTWRTCRAARRPGLWRSPWRRRSRPSISPAAKRCRSRRRPTSSRRPQRQTSRQPCSSPPRTTGATSTAAAPAWTRRLRSCSTPSASGCSSPITTRTRSRCSARRGATTTGSSLRSAGSTAWCASGPAPPASRSPATTAARGCTTRSTTRSARSS